MGLCVGEKGYSVLYSACLRWCVVDGKGDCEMEDVMQVGAMVTYMMDMMRWKEASFGSTWLTLVVSNLGFLIGGGLPKDG